MSLRSIVSRIPRVSTQMRAPALARNFTAQRIDGKGIAADVEVGITAEVAELKQKYGRQPGLAVILVGARPDSAKYVEMKKKTSAKCGFQSFETVLEADATQDELMDAIEKYNTDTDCHGILVQLPLPEHINQKEVLNYIDEDKDVDGFHPASVGALTRMGEELRQARQVFKTNEVGNVPCTPLGCIELLDRTGVDLSGKHVVVLGRSNIVGLPAALMAIHRNATVTVVHSRTTNIPEICRMADVIIAAIGQTEFVKGDWIKPGAVVIDVGVNFKDNPKRKSGKQMCGDVDYQAAKEVASAITPVPGGVGPMTICMLMQNTLTNARKAFSEESGDDATSLHYPPRNSFAEPL